MAMERSILDEIWTLWYIMEPQDAADSALGGQTGLFPEIGSFVDLSILTRQTWSRRRRRCRTFFHKRALPNII